MKKQHLLTLFLTLIFVSFTIVGVEAQTAPGTSIGGDDVCGSSAATACKLTDLGQITKGLLKLVVILGLPIMIILLAYRIVVAELAARTGNPGARMDALKKMGSSIVSFLFIIALFGGLLLAAFKLFGVDPAFLKFFNIIADAFVPHAYAQTGGLPNPTPNITSLYDFILATLRLVMQFFIYPAIIVIWVWTGFAFVSAQGNPTALATAKKWLVWAFVTTLIVFMLQMFVLALKGTVQQILPGQVLQTIPSSNGTPDNRGAPAAGAAGSACQINGSTGVLAADLVTCTVGRGAGSSNSAGFCTGKAQGTLCTLTGAGGVSLTGTCNFNSDQVYGCYRATQGDTCITGSGTVGTIDASNNCVVGGRQLTGRGGSCQINQQCRRDGLGQMSCVSGTCQ